MLFNDIKNDKSLINKITPIPYLSLSEKLFIMTGTEEVNGLVNNILVEQDGLYKIDRFQYLMHSTYQILSWYGQIEFEEDFTIEDYDFAVSEGVIDFIKSKAGNDIQMFMDLLDNMLNDELQNRNSISAIALKISNQLIQKLDEISKPENIKELSKQYKRIMKSNPELVDIIKGMS